MTTALSEMKSQPAATDPQAVQVRWIEQKHGAIAIEVALGKTCKRAIFKFRANAMFYMLGVQATLAAQGVRSVTSNKVEASVDQLESPLDSHN